MSGVDNPCTGPKNQVIPIKHGTNANFPKMRTSTQSASFFNRHSPPSSISSTFTPRLKRLIEKINRNHAEKIISLNLVRLVRLNGHKVEVLDGFTTLILQRFFCTRTQIGIVFFTATGTLILIKLCQNFLISFIFFHQVPLSPSCWNEHSYEKAGIALVKISKTYLPCLLTS